MRNITPGAAQGKNGSGSLILSSLQNRTVTPNGQEMLQTAYGFKTNDPSTWTLATLAAIGDRRKQMEALKKLLPELEEDLSAIMEGQISWDEMQSRIEAKGWKGLAKIEKGATKALIAESEFEQAVVQGKDRVAEFKKLHSSQTAEYKTFLQAECSSLLGKYKVNLDQRIEAMQTDPQMAEAISQWNHSGKSEMDILLEQSTLALKHGTSGFTHPKFLELAGMSGQSAAPVGFAQSYQQTATARPRDEIAFAWRGDAARATRKAVGGAIGTLMRGFQRIGKIAKNR
jgi:hypothetical protein